jgi:hypothetical protein
MIFNFPDPIPTDEEEYQVRIMASRALHNVPLPVAIRIIGRLHNLLVNQYRVECSNDELPPQATGTD